VASGIQHQAVLLQGGEQAEKQGQKQHSESLQCICRPHSLRYLTPCSGCGGTRTEEGQGNVGRGGVACGV